ncbi:hypothetical protein NZK32_00355 [Cyanobium sp. FGCU-52]|nr:hypothetical protein [Cyanobium sp. FGCU52]
MGVVAIAALVLTLVFFQFTVDDAYITFRHSLNLVEHGILSWNLEGPREEAFTNPLYVLLGVIGIKAGFKPELPIKIISLFIFFLWLFRAVRASTPSSRAKHILVASAFLLCIPAYIHAYSGLETLLFAYLLFEYLLSDDIGHPRDISIALLLLLCRPEGVLFVIASSGCLLIRRLNGSYVPSPEDGKWFFPVVLMGGLAFLVLGYKVFYFGDLFPNTFYAKAGKSQGIGAILGNFRSSAPWMVLAAFTLEWQRLKGWRIAKYSGFAVMYLVYLRSRLAMNYADRFWFQLFWPLIIYSIATNANILSTLSLGNVNRLWSSFSSSRLTVISLAGAAWIFSSIVGSPSSSLHLSTYFGRAIRSHANLGWQLNRYLPVGTTIWVGDAGLIPYYSRRMTYDLNFLGTRKIAKEGVTDEFLYEANPDVFILYSSGYTEAQTSKGQQDKELAYIREKGYQYVGGFPWSDYCMNVYASREVASALASKGFEHAQQVAMRNDRGKRAGFLEDVVLSYRYLLSPASVVPSVSNSGKQDK